MATVQDVTEPTSSWDPYARGCPSRDLLDRIGDKWTVLVLGELAKHGACRFTQLRKRLSGVSEKMLTQTLRSLERDGLVDRQAQPSVPPAVSYQLTALGRTLLEPMAAIQAWAERYINDVESARDAYPA